MRIKELKENINKNIWFFDIGYSYEGLKISIGKGLVLSVETFIDENFSDVCQVLIEDEEKNRITMSPEFCFLSEEEANSFKEQKRLNKEKE